MKQFFRRLWNQGIVSTFLLGLFGILPIVITVAVVSWIVTNLNALIGPETAVGRGLLALGLRFVANETAATVIGWVVVLTGICFVGVMLRSRVGSRLDRMLKAILNRIPIVKGIYGAAHQVITMLKKDDKGELTAMRVVFCSFGQERRVGLLALLVSHDTYQFNGQEYKVIYIPTSPLPMSGGIVFVVADAVTEVDMSADRLMQIYLSLGILTPQSLPTQYHRLPATP